MFYFRVGYNNREQANITNAILGSFYLKFAVSFLLKKAAEAGKVGFEVWQLPVSVG